MVKLKPSFFFNSKPEALEAAIQLVFPNVNVPRFPLLTVFDCEGGPSCNLVILGIRLYGTMVTFYHSILLNHMMQSD